MHIVKHKQTALFLWLLPEDNGSFLMVQKGTPIIRKDDGVPKSL